MRATSDTTTSKEKNIYPTRLGLWLLYAIELTIGVVFLPASLPYKQFQRLLLNQKT